MSLDAEIDRLYQLPLDEFTAARNELAKRAGPRGSEIRKLQKPPVAAWAVNQLYWKDRSTHAALVDAAEALRSAHTAVLSGKRGDLRFTGKEHDEAIERALKRTLSLLADAGHPVTDVTRNAVAQTLRALPSDDRPGRLTRALAPGGFEMLAGITVKGREGERRSQKPEARPPAKPQPVTTTLDRAEQRRQLEAREEAAAAAKALREAEQECRRAEFEAAREARAAARAEEALADAHVSLETARARFEEAQAQAAAAGKKKDAAERALAAATHEVAAARQRAATAAKVIKKQP